MAILIKILIFIKVQHQPDYYKVYSHNYILTNQTNLKGKTNLRWINNKIITFLINNKQYLNIAIINQLQKNLKANGWIIQY